MPRVDKLVVPVTKMSFMHPHSAKPPLITNQDELSLEEQMSSILSQAKLIIALQGSLKLQGELTALLTCPDLITTTIESAVNLQKHL